VDLPLSPILLYAGCALGALGVCISLPREKISAYLIGSVIAGAALGLVMLGLGLKNPDALPNLHFYLFSFIALAAALRVITHPRPIYSALYFVMTILASSGLYLILSAEFMTFALIIVYAGAILITYLFVIMLATEAPSEETPDALTQYDRVSREPIAATIAGFILLGGLTTMLALGLPNMKADPALAAGDRQLAFMSKKVEPVLKQAGLLKAGEKVVPSRVETTAYGTPKDGDATLDAIKIRGADGKERLLPRAEWPKDLSLSNTEGVAFSLINSHPGAIEIAGVILLMAMLGAVVLARKKVEMDEAAMEAAVKRQRSGGLAGMGDDELGVDGPFAAPGVGEGGAA